ncbi:MAG: AbrB/MazE/SpoVT family DNA-binding domain-containing protein [Eubacteriales bacterium]|nr:AbrB/MazE/SpoVT family DNA-binding domain-containing protein [Eubacteriales bacterium]
MKKAVITRKVDELGRVIVPMDFRRELGLPAGEDIAVHLSEPSDDGIITVNIDSENPNTKIMGELGFMFLPQTLRFGNGLHGVTLDFWVEDGMLHFKKTINQCLLTGETENLIQYKDTGKYISVHAVEELYAMIQGGK